MGSGDPRSVQLSYGHYQSYIIYPMFRERVRSFHFVGIGGIGMSGIAQILLDMGYEVSGSDIKENKNIELLRKKGSKGLYRA